jgi:hypothetical protein
MREKIGRAEKRSSGRFPRPRCGVVDAIGVVKIDQQGTSQIMKSPEGLLFPINEFLDASWRHMCVHNYAIVALRRAGLFIYRSS